MLGRKVRCCAVVTMDEVCEKDIMGWMGYTQDMRGGR
jgi:hypothetical protein